MNYSESSQILNLIHNSEKILLNCHNHPDPDSIGSATSMYEVLKALGKEVEIYCPTQIPDQYRFIPNSDLVKSYGFDQINFTDYDLMVVMDSADWARVSGDKKYNRPHDIKIINIDNHKTNTSFGDINLIKPEIASTCEMLWQIYKDWEIEINRNAALALLAGLYGDTGSFQYAQTTASTHRIAAELIDCGADHNVVVFNLYRSIDSHLLNFIKRALDNLHLEENFLWIAMDYATYEDTGKPDDVDIFDFLMNGIKNKDFGIRIIEREPGVVSVSMRSRVDFDVSTIAVALGGGGHQGAAGARLEGDFKEIVDRVLKSARDETNK